MPHSYWLVSWIMVILQIAAAFLFTHHFLVHHCQVTHGYWVTVSCILLLAQIQCIPYIKTSVFWYVGTIHYILPFSMALTAVVCADRLLERFRVHDFLLLLILQTLLGGCNYQAALLTLLTILTILLVRIRNREDTNLVKTGRCGLYKKALSLGIPFLFEMIGLIISASAPGNRGRAGASFGFNLLRAVRTILECFTEAASQMTGYVVHRTFAVIAVLTIGICMWILFQKMTVSRKMFSHPVFFVLLMCCLNAGVHAPALYAAVEVSGGVDNTNFMTTLMTSAASLIYLAGWLQGYGKKKKVVFLYLSVVAILCLAGRHSVKVMSDYVCYTYIQSGQAADYREQMQLQYRLMTDKRVTDPVVPFVNDEQGPLMQMPVTENPKAWSNQVTADFYGKNSVTAMNREQWMKVYGDRK